MNIILKNWKLKLLALLSAMLFWVIIIGIQATFSVFPEEIQIQPFNLATGLSVVNDLGSVKMTLDATPEILKTLTKKDFTAYVDLQGMGVGEAKADILVTSKNLNVNVIKTDPDQMDVLIEEIDTKTIPIRYILKGKPKDGYEVSKVSLSQEEIEIKGAKSAVQNAIEAVVTFALDGEEANESIKKGAVEVVDINTKEVPNIEIAKNDIEANISINQISERKTVGIKPSFIGELSKGWINKISIEPQTIMIKGGPEDLSKIDTLETEKIDLRTINGTSTIRASLKLPEGIETDKGIGEVKITLEIETQKE